MFVVKYPDGYWMGPHRPRHPFIGLEMTHEMALKIADLFGGTLVRSA